jgi:diguanylate cyclase (GGDEF)-like protein
MSSDSVDVILIVEDNPGDARLLQEYFNDRGLQKATLIYATNMADAESRLKEFPIDLILLDLGLPDAQGLDVVRRARAAAPHLPLIVLTGLDDESVATQALREGAQEYLVKGQLETRSLLRALRYAIERKNMEEAARRMSLEIAHAAKHDFLTGLPNRLLLYERITHAIALAKRHDKKLAVLFLDLDGFKHVNDSLGHSTGDQLLCSVAARLVECVRSTDTVSRQGGDEFVVLLSEIEESQDAAIGALRMLEAVATLNSVDQHDINITTSLGISIFPDDGEDAEALIKNADTAMYQAKDSGRQTYCFFKRSMNQKAVERQSIEADLRRALERQELWLCYQPKIDLRTKAIVGAEALIRWNHPTRGVLMPGQFIPIAEDCRLILPIGDWVLREACRQAQRWIAAGLSCGTMAVNVSAMQFWTDDFGERVFEILGDTGLDPKLLELEVTETVLMTRAELTAATLQTLRKRGIQIALDDFGTGYSSLSYLQKFPVDRLKIDRSFIRQIRMGGEEVALVTAIVDMAHALNLRVVAEGVETEQELLFLEERRCDEAQGYYFSRPVHPRAFEKLLEASDDAGQRWNAPSGTGARASPAAVSAMT